MTPSSPDELVNVPMLAGVASVRSALACCVTQKNRVPGFSRRSLRQHTNKVAAIACALSSRWLWLPTRCGVVLLDVHLPIVQGRQAHLPTGGMAGLGSGARLIVGGGATPPTLPGSHPSPDGLHGTQSPPG